MSPRIAPLLARHALGYADLATGELAVAGALLRQRMRATAACAVAAGLAVLMLCCLAVAVLRMWKRWRGAMRAAWRAWDGSLPSRRAATNLS